MSPTVLSAFLAFTFITAFTPGPNNILALSSGSRYGLKGSAPIVLGICLGLFCVMLLCAITAFSLSTVSNRFIAVMKYVGCFYVVWLAWKIVTANSAGAEKEKAVSGFMNGFILQFINIKIIIYGLAAFSSFVLPYYDSYLAILGFILTLSVIGSSGVVAWALAGAALQNFFNRYARTANAVMGVLLLGCAASMVV